MLKTPMDVLTMYPVRKSKKQKQAFRDAVETYATQLGYTFQTEKTRSKNVIIGDPERAKYLVTAHYDTCAALPAANRLYADNGLLYVMNQLYIGLLMTILPVISACVITVGTMLLYYMTHPQDTPVLGALIFVFSLFAFLPVPVLMGCYGPANKNNANDNTSGIVTVLEIMKSLPENQRSKVCFVLFDRNETGLQGSAAYAKKHKNTLQHQLVLNLSCVGDGDYILLLPTKNLKQNNSLLTSVYKCCGYFGPKSILVKEKGRPAYPDEHQNFPNAVGISAFKKGKNGYYIDRIHTSKDTILDITNVNLLRAAICSMICGDAAH